MCREPSRSMAFALPPANVAHDGFDGVSSFAAGAAQKTCGGTCPTRVALPVAGRCSTLGLLAPGEKFETVT